MLEWYEKQIDRIAQRIGFALIKRIYPELTRIDEESHRKWALWYSIHNASAWKRWRGWIALFIIGLIPLTIIVAGIVRCANGRAAQNSEIGCLALLAGAWLAGLIFTAALIELRRRPSAQSQHYRTLRIFGFDVCPRCGYDMAGHPCPNVTTVRTCPECGSRTPPLYVTPNKPASRPGGAQSL
jgi:hypothetical protein